MVEQKHLAIAALQHRLTYLLDAVRGSRRMQLDQYVSTPSTPGGATLLRLGSFSILYFGLRPAKKDATALYQIAEACRSESVSHFY